MKASYLALFTSLIPFAAALAHAGPTISLNPGSFVNVGNTTVTCSGNAAASLPRVSCECQVIQGERVDTGSYYGFKWTYNLLRVSRYPDGNHSEETLDTGQETIIDVAERGKAEMNNRCREALASHYLCKR
jgi:hypothetical protein